MGNRLRLTKNEDELIRGRYPDIDMDNLLMPMEGMASVTNLDMLVSNINYDVENRKGTDKELSLLNEVRAKAQYFKTHRGKNLVPGFESDKLCKKADDIAEKAIGEPIGNEMYRIDQLINYIRSIKDEGENEKEIILLSMYLGTKLGDIMLDEKVLNEGYDWGMVSRYKYPCLCNPASDLICNPIGFIYSKLKYNSSAEDKEGTTSDFYYRFLDAIQQR